MIAGVLMAILWSCALVDHAIGDNVANTALGPATPTPPPAVSR
ncbi:hypothetical protein ABZS77_23255 [Micromonospora sp. NPDC005298]